MKCITFIIICLLPFIPYATLSDEVNWTSHKYIDNEGEDIIFQLLSKERNNRNKFNKLRISGNAIHKTIMIYIASSLDNQTNINKHSHVLLKWSDGIIDKVEPRFIKIDGIPSNYFFLPGDVDDWITKIRKSDILSIKAELETGKVLTMTFDITGFEEVVNPYLDELWWW